TPARTRPAPAPQRACGHHTSAHTLRTHDSSCPGTVSQRHACPRWPRVVHPARRPWDSWWDSWSDSWSRARWQGLSASVLAIRRTGVKEGLNPYVDRVRAGSRGHRPDAVNDTMAPGQKTRWNAEKTSGDVKKNAGAPDMDYVMGFRVGGGVVVRRAGTGACPYGRRHRWGRRRRDVVVIDGGVGVATSSSSIRAWGSRRRRRHRSGRRYPRHAATKSDPSTDACQRLSSGISASSSTALGFRRATASIRSRAHSTPGSSL